MSIFWSLQWVVVKTDSISQKVGRFHFHFWGGWKVAQPRPAQPLLPSELTFPRFSSPTYTPTPTLGRTTYLVHTYCMHMSRALTKRQWQSQRQWQNNRDAVLPYSGLQLVVCTRQNYSRWDACHCFHLNVYYWSCSFLLCRQFLILIRQQSLSTKTVAFII